MQKKFKEKCVAPGCKRPQRVKKHGLCKPHLDRFYKYGFLDMRPIAKRTNHQPFDPARDIAKAENA